MLRINPLNLTICDEWFSYETLDIFTSKNNEPSVIFRLPPNSVTLITMDLRSLLKQEYNWVYGEDWAVSITIEKELDLMDDESPIKLPEQFLSSQTDKNDVLEFEVLAWDDLKMRVDVLIYNALYMNHRYVFLNSTSVEIRQPNRAIYGTEKVLIAILVEEYFITLPFN